MGGIVLKLNKQILEGRRKMKIGGILFWIGLLLFLIGVYFYASFHWFIKGALFQIFGFSLIAISFYLPESNGGRGIKPNKINFLGWLIILFWIISLIFFKKELFTTGVGGFICMVIGYSLANYKGKKD
ncbi:hypothetical protein [Neobacillus sp. NPDC093127]|uniref:hypothetical protein n=1 Tax=Neobacillus sp. NPDC093127 TaxID=3364296 RepID=UPI0038015440